MLQGNAFDAAHHHHGGDGRLLAPAPPSHRRRAAAAVAEAVAADVVVPWAERASFVDPPVSAAEAAARFAGSLQMRVFPPDFEQAPKLGLTAANWESFFQVGDRVSEGASKRLRGALSPRKACVWSRVWGRDEGGST